MVLHGAARLQLEDRTIDLAPGGYINLPAHTKHQVEWKTTVQPTIWLAEFYKPWAFPAFDIPASTG
jgi:cupin 2 domain-containing protein